MYLSIGHRHGAYFVVHNNRLLVFVSEAWSKIPKKMIFMIQEAIIYLLVQTINQNSF
jgi:hypothetical protein